ncbi:MAG: hypothetical protein ACON4T_09230 [Synechococcus sp.]
MKNTFKTYFLVVSLLRSPSEPPSSQQSKTAGNGERISQATSSTQETAEPNPDLIAISLMKSESKRVLLTIQRKAINPITDKPMFRTADEVLEEALEVFYQHLKGEKVI